MSMERIRRYAVRLLVVLLCLAAWADMRPFSASGNTLPIAVVDISGSVGGGGADVPETLQVRPHWLLVADGTQRVVGHAEPARLGRGATRLGAALRDAARTWPGADILLLTDGRDTEGDARAGARAVAAAGGRVFVGPPGRSVADVGVVWARLTAGSPEARVSARVSSSTSGRAELRLSRNGRIVARESLVLRPGMDRDITLTDGDVPRGGCTYRVALVAEAGTPNDDPGNDALVVAYRPEQRVVLTWGLGEEARGLAGKNLVVRRVEESGPDPDLGDLAAADCLVMANLPWRDVGTAAARAVERFVASGGSLMVLGGREAYAAGAWAGTRFERRVCPLRVRREEGTGLALVLAVDRSGSTAGATLAHLKEAVRRALQGIVPSERMAVLPFDHAPAERLLPPGVVSSGEDEALGELLDAVDALAAGGDTDLAAAIEEAARRAATIPARRRRVVLLTDGDPDHPPDGDALRRARRVLGETGVDFAALVIGDPAAVKMLRTFVALRPEDVLPLDDPQALPLQLLHWLGRLRGRKAERPRPKRLTLAEGFRDQVFVDGFRPRNLEWLEIATDAGARALVWAEYEDLVPRRVPFAAERALGAGHVVALAWGPSLESRRARPAAVVRLQGWVARLAARADRGLSGEIEGDVLLVRFPQASGGGGLVVRSTSDSRHLVETAPGLFRGPLPTGHDDGIWVSTPGSSPDGAGPGRERPLRLPALPPAESRATGLDTERMAAIAEAGGGWRLRHGEQPPRPARTPGRPLAPWLLLGACALLLLDRLWSKPHGSKPHGSATDW